MFGQNDQHQDQNDNQQPASVVEPTADGSLGAPAVPTNDDNDDANVSVPSVTPDDDANNASVSENTSPAPTAPTAPSAPSTSTRGDDDSNVPGDLLAIKQQALQQLSPLVGHLDQTPEEKFRTLMMMIQASDNQELVKAAYDVANDIPDEKARAQALLDIVNEINYFTQHQSE